MATKYGDRRVSLTGRSIHRTFIEPYFVGPRLVLGDKQLEQ